MVTINIAIIATVAKWVVAVSGGVAVVVAVIKRMLRPILDPLREVAEKQQAIEECLQRDKQRLEDHDKVLNMLVKDNETELISFKMLINHLRTGNNSATMQQIENQLDEYLAKRV